MSEDGLSSFFDLGNSLRRGDDTTIGEKGHGTKVYFNSKKIEVITIKDNKRYHAVMLEPSKELFERRIPKVSVTIEEIDGCDTGTSIIIWGYNNNRRDKFTHEQLKDYILWFTKFGSIEKEVGVYDNKDVKLRLKGIDRKQFEELEYGHVFPKESKRVADLFDQYLVDAPKWYCKKFIKIGNLRNMPEIEYQAVFFIVKAKDDIPIKTSKLYYVEFKNYLTKEFNHSFENLHSIVCWDINLNELRNNDEVVDIANERRTLKIVQPEAVNDYTRYYLDSLRSRRKIEVFVLKYYLKERLKIEFMPRTDDSTV